MVDVYIMVDGGIFHKERQDVQGRMTALFDPDGSGKVLKFLLAFDPKTTHGVKVWCQR